VNLFVTWPVSWVELTSVVVICTPFSAIVDPEIKLLPFTVNVNAAEPTVTLVGEMDEIAATGVAPVIVKIAVAEVPPPGAGFTTFTLPVPGITTSTVGMEAEIEVLLP
jgi:hypothetical protein